MLFGCGQAKDVTSSEEVDVDKGVVKASELNTSFTEVENEEDTNKKEDELATEDKEEKKIKKKDVDTKKKEKKKVKKDVETTVLKGNYMSTVDLNVRSNPSLKSDTIGSLQAHKKVVVTEKTVKKDADGIVWYKVKQGDRTGWASSNYLTEYKEVSKSNKKNDKKTSSKKKTSNNRAVSTASGDFMSTKSINVYNSANGSSVGTLNPYQKIVATHKTEAGGGTWYKVSFKNQTFWVKANDVTTYKAQAKPTATQSSNSSKGNNSSGKGHNYPPNSITFNGKTVYYQNVGYGDSIDGNGEVQGESSKAQTVIDTTNKAATFGGASTFSGTDGMNTHFIGHNGGRNQFGGMHNASTFVVTDSSGRAFEYVKTARYIVDEYGVRTDNGKEMWDRIVGTGGGERITLQSTYNHPLKWIVEAKFNRELK